MKTGETYNLSKKRSSCSNQNLDGSMDTEDNGGISMNLHYFKTIQFEGVLLFEKGLLTKFTKI